MGRDVSCLEQPQKHNSRKYKIPIFCTFTLECVNLLEPANAALIAVKSQLVGMPVTRTVSIRSKGHYGFSDEEILSAESTEELEVLECWVGRGTQQGVEDHRAHLRQPLFQGVAKRRVSMGDGDLDSRTSSPHVGQ